MAADPPYYVVDGLSECPDQSFSGEHPHSLKYYHSKSEVLYVKHSIDCYTVYILYIRVFFGGWFVRIHACNFWPPLL